MFLSRRQSRKEFPSLHSKLHLNFYVVPFEPFNHELIFLTWRKPGPDRFPWTTATNATVFRLRDTDQTFFRHRIDRMVINFETPFKFSTSWHSFLVKSLFDAWASTNSA